jgi:hypothetical protein
MANVTKTSALSAQNSWRERKIRNDHTSIFALDKKSGEDRLPTQLILGDRRFLSLFIVSTAVSQNGGTVKSLTIWSVWIKN